MLKYQISPENVNFQIVKKSKDMATRDPQLAGAE